jgi:hypothetical protein
MRSIMSSRLAGTASRWSEQLRQIPIHEGLTRVPARQRNHSCGDRVKPAATVASKRIAAVNACAPNHRELFAESLAAGPFASPLVAIL